MEALRKLNVNRILGILFSLSVFVAVGSNWYHYYYTGNYDYLVEAECDLGKEKCFYRDCLASPENCPPNQFSAYKKFNIKAYDFLKCTDNSCKNECETGKISCAPIMCGQNPSDQCAENEH